MIISLDIVLPGTKESGIEYRIVENYHTHMYLCHHAEGDTIDYAKEASEKTYIKVLGMSDHGPLLYNMSSIYLSEEELAERNSRKNGYHSTRMDMDEFLNIYLPSIEKANEEYKDIKVLKSLEMEYIPGHDDYYKELASHCDYLVLGQHYFLSELAKKLLNYDQVNSDNVIEYATQIAEGINAGLFKVIAHPDCFMSDYISEDGIKRKYDDKAIQATRIILDACAKNDCAIEYNANGVIRGKHLNYDGTYDYTYPRKEFFQIAKKEYPTVKVLLGIDAHIPVRLHANHLEICKSNLIELGIVPDNVEVIKK